MTIQRVGKAIEQSIIRDKVDDEVRGKAVGKAKHTVCTFTAGDAKIAVTFDREASDAEGIDALENAFGQTRAKLSGPQLAS